MRCGYELNATPTARNWPVPNKRVVPPCCSDSKTVGKSNYTLSSAAGEEFGVAVAGTTTITQQNAPVGRIVPADGAARFEDGGGTVMAVVQPHTGSKADNAWHHRLLSPPGTNSVSSP